jgi:hypothetical protein
MWEESRSCRRSVEDIESIDDQIPLDEMPVSMTERCRFTSVFYMVAAGLLKPEFLSGTSFKMNIS